MIRGNNVASGTSSTGSGPFSLVAAPTALGVVDLYTAMAAQGLSGSSAIPVPLVLTEYTDATFTTPKQKMGFIGGVSLGASLTATTVSVLRLNWTQTSLNTSTPTYSVQSPTVISVGVAANTLIEIDVTCGQVVAPPVGLSGMSTDLARPGAMGLTNPAVGNGGTFALASGEIYYFPHKVTAEVTAAVARVNVLGTYTGGTANLYFGLYAPDPVTGKPGKLIADYGGLGTPGSAFASSALLASNPLANPPTLSPGFIWKAFQAIYSGGNGSASLRGYANWPDNIMMMGWYNYALIVSAMLATGTGATAWSDPAVAPNGSDNSNSINTEPLLGLWSS